MPLHQQLACVVTLAQETTTVPERKHKASAGANVAGHSAFIELPDLRDLRGAAAMATLRREINLSRVMRAEVVVSAVYQVSSRLAERHGGLIPAAELKRVLLAISNAL